MENGVVGKTYFWNNKIKPKIDGMQYNGKRFTSIYMSLYGISNLEEISKKHNTRSKKTVKLKKDDECLK